MQRNYKSRIDRINKQLHDEDDDEIIIRVDYVRDWRSDKPQDIAETKYIKLGYGFVEIDHESKLPKQD